MVSIYASFLMRAGLSVCQQLWCKFTDGITVVCKYGSVIWYLTTDYNLSSINLIAQKSSDKFSLNRYSYGIMKYPLLPQFLSQGLIPMKPYRDHYTLLPIQKILVEIRLLVDRINMPYLVLQFEDHRMLGKLQIQIQRAILDVLSLYMDKYHLTIHY